MKLPNSDLAVIDDRQLAEYSLNLDHDEGKHKARVFKSALNMDVSHLEELKQALWSALKTIDRYQTISKRGIEYNNIWKSWG